MTARAGSRKPARAPSNVAAKTLVAFVHVTPALRPPPPPLGTCLISPSGPCVVGNRATVPFSVKLIEPVSPLASGLPCAAVSFCAVQRSRSLDVRWHQPPLQTWSASLAVSGKTCQVFVAGSYVGPLGS